MKASFIATLSIRLFLLCTTVRALYNCPSVKCKSCVTIKQHDAPGIGIDLSTSQGTAAIHLLNGTVIDVEPVPAQQEYQDLLSRLTKAPEPRQPSRWEQWRRWLNQKRGLPATAEIGILSTLISEVAKNVNAVLLEEHADRVVVTAPLLSALTQDVLNEAIEYAGLHTWLFDVTMFPIRLSQSRAHYAGQGEGLCKTYKNLCDCEDEESEMPRETVYYVQFTRKALYTTIDTFRSAFSWTTDREPFLMDYSLGLDRLNEFGSRDEYWTRIRNHVRTLPSKSREPITRVLLAGDSVTDEKFLAVFRDSLFDICGSQKLEIDTTNIASPLFTAARGAAVYARWRQEAPTDCVEETKCEEERERKRKASGNIKVELK